MGGINDAVNKRNEFTSDEEFKFSATRGLQKILELNRQRSFDKITYVPSLTLVSQSDELSERIHFLEYTATCLFDGIENISVQTIDPVKMNEDGIHPDRAGVGAILHQLADDSVIEDLIIDRNYIVSSGWYRGVQPAHAYGCHTCYAYQRAKGGTMCEGCRNEFSLKENTNFDTENFPNLEDSKKGEKRTRTDTPTTQIPTAKKVPSTRGGRAASTRNPWM